MAAHLSVKATLLTLMISTKICTQSITTYPLDADWSFQSAFELNPRAEELGRNIKTDWHKTKLPNTVLNALFENGLIEDPFVRNNEARLQWLEKNEWVFQKKFDANPEMLKAQHAELVLSGLDTYADVYLNDALVIKGDNMFRTWKADVHNFLKAKDNVLKIYFASPINKDKLAADNSYTDLPAIPENTRVYSRKAGFHYGWDWGPRFVTCGLQSAEIQIWDDFRMTDVYLKHTNISSEKATLQAQVTVESTKETNVTVNIQFGDKTFSQKASVSVGSNIVYVDVVIPKPKLWWTHNLGTPYLYDVKTTVNTEGGQVFEKKMKHGLRTIELVQEKDGIGESFYFRLNGVPIFAKGSNMIPINFFQERVKKADISRVIDAAVGANMNMLRVWGGGIYQPNAFYQECDEKGLLIWQDFMYACAMYPGDDTFLENARQEAVEQVQRLRNYSCMALWCGNNEINEAWNNWGWQTRFNPDQKAYIWKAYQDIFQSILPKAVRENASEMAYYESSPRFGRYNNKSYTEGDNHDWFVWHDEKPFEHFEEKIPRFASEYGFQSFPEWKTIQSFTQPQDQKLESEVMLVHQKHPKGNALMKKYMDRTYRTPKSFADFVYVSQLVQADGIRRAIEAQRRSMPKCMGSLYWQLNDVWQGASWSSIDNFGRWKALQYAAREAYSNVLISPVVTKDSLKIHIINDQLESFEGELFVQVMDMKGHTFFMDGRYLKINGNSNDIYYTNILKKVMLEQDPHNSFIFVTFRPKNQPPVSRTVFLVPPKELVLQKNEKMFKEITMVDGGYNIRIQSPSLLKNVCLSFDTEGSFSDNFFDVVPNQTYNVFLKTSATTSLLEVYKALKVTSLVDTY
jgi:beta-mannosidase